MLRYCAHQAEGLLALGDLQTARLLAVIQHGDEQAELPFLWRLCLALTQQGYSVTVLDATSAESAENPGLLQRLAQASTATPPPAGAWTVLPSADGLSQLAVTSQAHQRGWHQLLRAFVGTGVLILYGHAEGVAHTLKGLDAPTLLPVSPVRSSLLTSYLALKRLLILGGHRPTIIDVQSPEADLEGAGVPAVSTSLVECAKNFLNFEVKVIPFADTDDDGEAAGNFNQFAMSLLETAASGALVGAPSMAASGRNMPHDGPVAAFMRSADVHR